MNAAIVTCDWQEAGKEGREVARRGSLRVLQCHDGQEAVIHSSVTCCLGDKCNPGVFFFPPSLLFFDWSHY